MAQNRRTIGIPRLALSEELQAQIRKAEQVGGITHAEYTRRWNERQAEGARVAQMLTVEQVRRLQQRPSTTASAAVAASSSSSSSSSSSFTPTRTSYATAVRISTDEVPAKLRKLWVLPAQSRADMQRAQQMAELTPEEHNRQMAEKQKKTADLWTAHLARQGKQKANGRKKSAAEREEGEVDGAPVQMPDEDLHVRRSQTEEGEIRETQRKKISPRTTVVGSSREGQRDGLFVSQAVGGSTSNAPSTSRPRPTPTIAAPVAPVASSSTTTTTTASTSPTATTPTRNTLTSPTATPTAVVKEWWKTINPKSRRMIETAKDPAKRQLHATLGSFKDCISRCEALIQQSATASSSTSRGSNPTIQWQATLDKEFNELRNHIHKAEFLPGIDEYVLARAHMLDNGLTRIFSPTNRTADSFPLDIREDAKQLYVRWSEKNFSIELLRGIIPSLTKDANRSADKIDAKFKRKYGRNANFYGQGDLVLGQWWPTQLCTVRDGAHGSAQGGIFGEKGKGAYSVIVAGGSGYEDKDEGDVVLYCGTEAKDGATAPTENTTRLIESCDLPKGRPNVDRQPVRLIRSANLPSGNPYRPERGYRYDGLYEVVGYERLKHEGAVYRFKLVRCPGQGPIRCEGLGKRPTRWEVEAYDKEVAERGFGLSEAMNAR